MDLESLLKHDSLAPIEPEAQMTPREARARDQFAREYAEQTRMTRDALLGSPK